MRKLRAIMKIGSRTFRKELKFNWILKTNRFGFCNQDHKLNKTNNKFLVESLMKE